jgi:hypothetical protein
MTLAPPLEKQQLVLEAAKLAQAAYAQVSQRFLDSAQRLNAK